MIYLLNLLRGYIMYTSDQEKFLRETIEHYTLLNRGLDVVSENCSYKDGCAIGRHMTQESIDKMPNMPVGALSEEDYVLYIPEKLRALGLPFLAYIQSMHDNSKNWNNYGLSDIGETFVKEFCHKFGMDINNVMFAV